MTRGRKPTPDAIRILRGQKPRSAVQPVKALPDPPEHLDELALEEWHRLAGELFKLGLLTGCDRAALAAYCVCYSRWVHAENELAKTGLVIRSPQGFAQTNPFCTIARQSLQQLRQFASELGLSPAARQKVSVTPTDPEMDEFSKRQQMANERDARHERARLELLANDNDDDDLDDHADELVDPSEIPNPCPET